MLELETTAACVEGTWEGMMLKVKCGVTFQKILTSCLLTPSGSLIPDCTAVGAGVG